MSGGVNESSKRKMVTNCEGTWVKRKMETNFDGTLVERKIETKFDGKLTWTVSGVFD